MSATNLTFGEVRLQIAKRFPGYDPEVVTSFLNERYRDVCRLCNWTSLKLRAMFSTSAPYQTGTVAVSSGSVALTGTGTAWAAAMSGWWIRFGSDDSYYTFIQTSPTTATLDRPYEGVDNAAASYTLWRTIFVLPDDVREPSEFTVMNPAGAILPTSETVLDADDPTRTRRGKPSRWAPYQSDASTPERQQIELSPGPDKVYGIQFWYVQDPSMFEMSDTAVFLPKWFTPNALYHGVEADIRRVLDKDLNLAGAAETLFDKDVLGLKATDAMKKGPTRLQQSAWAQRRLSETRSEDYIDRYLSE